MTAQDLRELRLVRDYTSVDGVRHLTWAQVIDGITVVDGDLRANVTRDGRLVNVLGGIRRAPDAGSVPRLSARQAFSRTLRSVDRPARPPAVRVPRKGAQRLTRFARDGEARLVWYRSGDRLRLAWRVVARVGRDGDYDALVDAAGGRVVRRRNLVRFATALVFEHHPGAPVGGTQQPREIGQWLRPRARRLIGNNAHAFRDVDDVVELDITEDEIVDTFDPPRSGDVPPSSHPDWLYPLEPVADPAGFCPPFPGCTWNHRVPFSWQTNDEQATTQLFYFVNRIHDHLYRPPIGFDEASGNFQRRNPRGVGVDRDEVLAQSDDGANTNGAGLPDEDHRNNANFDTRPDGVPGRMQMYLFQPEPTAFGTLPFAAVNGSDDPSIVWHEYAHGLSNRLITDVQGFGAVFGAQSAAMGEAWSDWYALDLLSRDGLIADAPAPGDVKVGAYVDGGDNLIRSQPVDCPPDVGSVACPGFPETGPGGYTYADFGRILAGLPGGVGLPEPHADGEIWGQTLWQLRQALVARYGEQEGSDRAERYITGGMRLGPPQPTFLDQRNAILQADAVAGGRDADSIWAVFASRGMGWFASTRGDSDDSPEADFTLPPAAGGPTGTLEGVVRDDAGRPLADVLVGLGGHDGPPGVGPALQAVSDARGRYRIADVPTAEYPHVTALGPAGYTDLVDGPVTIGAAAVTRDITLRRNWADVRAGATIATDARDESQVGCGPDKLVDGDVDTAVDTASPDDEDTPPIESDPRTFTVTLPRPVDGAEVHIDPTYGCYTLGSSSLGRFTLQVSTDGATFATVADGLFDRSDQFRMNRVPTRGMPDGVRVVRLIARSTQAPVVGIMDFGFLSFSELQVLGRPGRGPAA